MFTMAITGIMEIRAIRTTSDIIKVIKDFCFLNDHEFKLSVTPAEPSLSSDLVQQKVFGIFGVVAQNTLVCTVGKHIFFNFLFFNIYSTHNFKSGPLRVCLFFQLHAFLSGLHKLHKLKVKL